MSYYKTINGKKMDSRLLDLAETAAMGQGDGRISKQDAALIIDALKDGGEYTDIEKDTMEYIRTTYRWTDGADEWFRSEVASWAASKS
jgi:hypothetical protein